MDDFDGSFQELYRRAYRVAFRLLGDRGRSEDVAQEALARAYGRWRKIDGYQQAWVAKVSANLAISAWRRSQRRWLPAGQSAVDPADAVVRIDLHRALAQLPKRQREVVVLRYLADLSERDVAAVLGCTPGTVKQHGSRGLAALRAVIGEAPVEVEQ